MRRKDRRMALWSKQIHWLSGLLDADVAGESFALMTDPFFLVEGPIYEVCGDGRTGFPQYRRLQ